MPTEFLRPFLHYVGPTQRADHHFDWITKDRVIIRWLQKHFLGANSPSERQTKQKRRQQIHVEMALNGKGRPRRQCSSLVDTSSAAIKSCIGLALDHRWHCCHCIGSPRDQRFMRRTAEGPLISVMSNGRGIDLNPCQMAKNLSGPFARGCFPELLKFN